jgi:hypothetical protein
MAGNTMAKRKRTITDLQNISPTAIYFFTGSKNEICIDHLTFRMFFSEEKNILIMW